MATNKVTRRKPAQVSYKMQLREISKRKGWLEGELEWWLSEEMEGPASIPRNRDMIARMRKELEWFRKRETYLRGKIDSEKFIPKNNNGLAKQVPLQNVRFYNYVTKNPQASLQANLVHVESTRPASSLLDKAQNGFIYHRAVWFPRGNKYKPEQIGRRECLRRLAKLSSSQGIVTRQA